VSAPKHRKAQPRHIIAAQAADLRVQGLSGRRIAAQLGISQSYAYELINDPAGEQGRQRKKQQGGTCMECGARTSYVTGGAASKCLDCARSEHAERNERIFEAWERGETGPVIAAREGMTTTAVQGLVDTYRRRYGMPLSLHRLRNRTHWEYIRRRWNVDGASAVEIAEELGYPHRCHVQEQIKTMRARGMHLEHRNIAYDDATIAAAVQSVRDGATAYSVAKTLGVPAATVYRWMDKASMERQAA
jgi:transposase